MYLELCLICIHTKNSLETGLLILASAEGRSSLFNKSQLNSSFSALIACYTIFELQYFEMCLLQKHQKLIKNSYLNALSD